MTPQVVGDDLLVTNPTRVQKAINETIEQCNDAISALQEVAIVPSGAD